MTGQPGFFDLSDRLRDLSAKGDDLERIAALVDFAQFRPEQERAVPRTDGSKGGRPPFDRVLMFKVLLLVAIAPGLFAGVPDSVDVARRLAPPSAANWFGTDETGRDVYARVLHGAGTTLGIVGAAVLLAATIGGCAGAVAGFFGRLGDMALSRGADALLAFPPIILGVVIAATLGPGAVNLILALGIIYAPVFFRIARAASLARARAPMWRRRAHWATANGPCCCAMSRRTCCRRCCCNA